MPLKELNVDLTQVKDLLPLKDLKLTHLSLVAAPVSDLSPLKVLNVDPTLAQRESQLLRSIGTLEKVNGKPVQQVRPRRRTWTKPWKRQPLKIG